MWSKLAKALKILMMTVTALVLTAGILRAHPIDPDDYLETGGTFVFMLILVGLIDAMLTGVLDRRHR